MGPCTCILSAFHQGPETSIRRYLDIFRMEPEQDLLANKILRNGVSVGRKRRRNCPVAHLRKNQRAAFLFQSAGDEIHWRIAEKFGDREICWCVVNIFRRTTLLDCAICEHHSSFGEPERFRWIPCRI